MYTTIKLEIDGLIDLVKSLDDEELVAEVHELCYDSESEEASDILHNFWYSGELPEGDREYLQWLYVTAWTEKAYEE